MDSLRISLIVIGIIILLALFFGSKLIAKRRAPQQPSRKTPPFDHSTPQGQADDWEVIPLKSSDKPPSTAAATEVADAAPPVTDDLEAESVVENSVEVATAETAPASESSESDEKPATTPTVPAVIALHIVAKEGEFVGAELVKSANLTAMRYGEMGIFHFLGVTSGAVTFRMANMLEPGTFDLENLNGFTTPGVLIFMESEQQDDLTTSLNSMLKVAQSICERLDGQLCDGRRQPMNSKQLERWKTDLLSSQITMSL